MLSFVLVPLLSSMLTFGGLLGFNFQFFRVFLKTFFAAFKNRMA